MFVGCTLGEVALGQLTAVSLQPLDNVEMKARFLSLMGKYFKLLAVQKEPIYICALWDQQVDKVHIPNFLEFSK